MDRGRCSRWYFCCVRSLLVSRRRRGVNDCSDAGCTLLGRGRARRCSRPGCTATWRRWCAVCWSKHRVCWWWHVVGPAGMLLRCSPHCVAADTAARSRSYWSSLHVARASSWNPRQHHRHTRVLNALSACSVSVACAQPNSQLLYAQAGTV